MDALFQRKKIGMFLLFDKDLLSAQDPSAQLYLWSILRDDQVCLDVLMDMEAKSAGKIFQYFHEQNQNDKGYSRKLRNLDPAMVSNFEKEIDKCLENMGGFVSLRTFEPFAGARVWRLIRRKIYSNRNPEESMDFYLQCHLKGYRDNNWIKEYRDRD